MYFVGGSVVVGLALKETAALQSSSPLSLVVPVAG